MAMTVQNGTYAVLQPFLTTPMGNVGNMPKALGSALFPCATLTASSPPGVVAIGLSRFADPAMSVASVHSHYRFLFEGAAVTFLEPGSDDPVEGFPSLHSFRMAAAAIPPSLVTFFVGCDDRSAVLDDNGFLLLEEAMRYCRAGAEVRMVVPPAVQGFAEAALQALPLLDPQYDRQDFTWSHQSLLVFCGRVDPKAWLYNELHIETLLPSGLSEREIQVIEALDLLQDPRFYAIARALAEDRTVNIDVRIAAIYAVLHSGRPDTFDFLLKRMDHDGYAKVVAAVVTAFGELGDVRAIPRLEAARDNDGDPMVRAAARAALTRLRQMQQGSPQPRPQMSMADLMPNGWSHRAATDTVVDDSADLRDRARQALALQFWADNNP